MARTYAFCVGDAPIPWELTTYRTIEVFGVKAVTGKDILTHAEIHGMKTAHFVEMLYRQREASGAWAEWGSKHPKEFEFLEVARKLWQSK